MVAWFMSVESPGIYENVWSFVPTVLYSIAIIVMNQLYRPLAIQLNEWGKLSSLYSCQEKWILHSSFNTCVAVAYYTVKGNYRAQKL